MVKNNTFKSKLMMSRGRNFGAKSPEVREWMLNSNNYELDQYTLNQSAGAKLTETYLPPKK